MSNQEIFELFTNKGEEFHNSYLDTNEETVLFVTVITHPNVLRKAPSIYSKKSQLNATSILVKDFYSSRGLNVKFAGPHGLGGGGIWDIGNIIAFIVAHASLFKITLPILYKVGRRIYARYKVYKQDKWDEMFRTTKPIVGISLSYFTLDDDLPPQLQQLISSTYDLREQLLQRLSYLDFSISCNIYSQLTEASISLDMKQTYTKKDLAKLSSKVGKLKPSSSHARLDLYIKRRFGFLRIIRKKPDRVHKFKRT